MKFPEIVFEQLELFPELVALWEEDARWYTILRQRIDDVGGNT